MLGLSPQWSSRDVRTLLFGMGIQALVKGHEMDWRDGSAVRSTCYSCRGLEFESQPLEGLGVELISPLGTPDLTHPTNPHPAWSPLEALATLPGGGCSLELPLYQAWCTSDPRPPNSPVPLFSATITWRHRVGVQTPWASWSFSLVPSLGHQHRMIIHSAS